MHLLHKVQTFSTASLGWKTQIKQAHLASQISSILLQRRNWAPLLQNLNLHSKLNPPLFLQILHKTQSNPQLSLDFFNWAKSNLRFQPDLKSQCRVIHLSLGSGLIQPARPILDSVVQTYHVSELVHCMTQVCKGADSQSSVLSFVIECYAKKGLVREGVEVYREMRSLSLGFVPSVVACNALLNVMQKENVTRLGWCFFGAMIRNGVLPDQFTWSLVAQLFYKVGKFERIIRILDLGVCGSVVYDLVVDGYSKSGDFDAAFYHLEKMSERRLEPGFGTCSCILDGACKVGDMRVVERVISIMQEKNLMTNSRAFKYDWIVQKLCELDKTYAAEMFFKKAWDEKIGLQDATYAFVMKALTRQVRIVEAIQVYRLICERRIVVDDSSYHAFANGICKGVRSEEDFELLMDVIRKGFSPCASELSGFISFLCNRRRWREAEDLLNSVLDKGLLPDLICCSSLVRHYCSRRRIDSAIEMHSKMEKLDGRLDATTYNVLLSELFAAERVEEAVRVFNYMRIHNSLSSESFTIMIHSLCHVKELRKAMKIHDDMLKLGLKPPAATYKRLICGFK